MQRLKEGNIDVIDVVDEKKEKALKKKRDEARIQQESIERGKSHIIMVFSFIITRLAVEVIL